MLNAYGRIRRIFLYIVDINDNIIRDWNFDPSVYHLLVALIGNLLPERQLITWRNTCGGNSRRINQGMQGVYLRHVSIDCEGNVENRIQILVGTESESCRCLIIADNFIFRSAVRQIKHGDIYAKIINLIRVPGITPRL